MLLRPEIDNIAKFFDQFVIDLALREPVQVSLLLVEEVQVVLAMLSIVAPGGSAIEEVFPTIALRI